MRRLIGRLLLAGVAVAATATMIQQLQARRNNMGTDTQLLRQVHLATMLSPVTQTTGWAPVVTGSQTEISTSLMIARDSLPVVAATPQYAQRICSQVGATLCTQQQWTQACQGDHGYTYSYGNTYRPTACNTIRRGGRLTQAGASPQCINAHGVEDLGGNLWQWVVPDGASSLDDAPFAVAKGGSAV